MASISAIRSALATNLQTISGLRSGGTIPDLVNPPFCLITPSSVSYNRALSNGLTEYNFTLTAIVGRASERTAQNLLDAYCQPTGATSIKSAVESDKTLGGNAYDLRVTNMRNYGSTTIGETTYLAAEFDLVVYSD
jgi:hypothetical protein